MPSKIAIAAAALLVSGSTAATTSPVTPTPAVYSANGPTLGISQARLKRLRIPSWRANFSGSFIDVSGKHYNALGDGTFWLVIGEGGETELKYSITITAHPQSFPFNVIELGEMQGQGPTDGPGPERMGFAIHGTRNDRGNSIDVFGNISGGRIEGAFQISGDNGKGQGDFSGL